MPVYLKDLKTIRQEAYKQKLKREEEQERYEQERLAQQEIEREIEREERNEQRRQKENQERAERELKQQELEKQRELEDLLEIHREKEPIITEQDIRQSFYDWSTGCKCNEKLILIEDQPGTNWTFYKKCPKCNMNSTKIYHTEETVDEFYQSPFGKMFMEQI